MKSLIFNSCLLVSLFSLDCFAMCRSHIVSEIFNHPLQKHQVSKEIVKQLPWFVFKNNTPVVIQMISCGQNAMPLNPWQLNNMVMQMKDDSCWRFVIYGCEFKNNQWNAITNSDSVTVALQQIPILQMFRDCMIHEYEEGIQKIIKRCYNNVDILHLAFMYGRRNLVEKLIENGADINAKDECGTTLLTKVEFNFGSVKYLIEKLGADINADSHKSPLHTAIFFDDLNVIKYFVEHGADVNAKNSRGLTALGQAFYYQRMDVIHYLIEHGANLNVLGINKRPLLHEAIALNKFEIVKSLVDRDVDVNSVDSRGNSALGVAIKYGNVEIVKYLVEHGADVNYIDTFRTSLLNEAILVGNLDIIKCLVEYGCDLTQHIEYRVGCYSTEHEVKLTNYIEIIQYLEKQRAKVMLTN